MTGVKVKNEAGKYVILAGDAAYAPESWEKLVLPGITVNKKDELNSLKRLKEMSEDEDCAAILTAHDPGVLNAVIEL